MSAAMIATFIGLLLFFALLFDPWKREVAACHSRLDEHQKSADLRILVEQFARYQPGSGLDTVLRRDVTYRKYTPSFVSKLRVIMSDEAIAQADGETLVDYYRIVYHTACKRFGSEGRLAFETAGDHIFDALLHKSKERLAASPSPTTLSSIRHGLYANLTPLYTGHADRIDAFCMNAVIEMTEKNIALHECDALRAVLADIDGDLPPETADTMRTAWQQLYHHWHRQIGARAGIDPSDRITERVKQAAWPAEFDSRLAELEHDIEQFVDARKHRVALFAALTAFDHAAAQDVMTVMANGSRANLPESKWLDDIVDRMRRLYKVDLSAHHDILAEMLEIATSSDAPTDSDPQLQHLLGQWHGTHVLLAGLNGDTRIDQLENSGLWSVYPPSRIHLDRKWIGALTAFSRSIESDAFLDALVDFPELPDRIRHDNVVVIEPLRDKLLAAFDALIFGKNEVDQRFQRIERVRSALSAYKGNILTRPDLDLLAEQIQRAMTVMQLKLPDFRSDMWHVEIRGDNPSPGEVMEIGGLRDGDIIEILWSNTESDYRCEPWETLVFRGGHGAILSIPTPLPYRKVILDCLPTHRKLIKYKLVGPTEWQPIGRQFDDAFKHVEGPLELATNRNYLFTGTIPGLPPWETVIYLSSTDSTPYTVAVPISPQQTDAH